LRDQFDPEVSECFYNIFLVMHNSESFEGYFQQNGKEVKAIFYKITIGYLLA